MYTCCGCNCSQAAPRPIHRIADEVNHSCGRRVRIHDGIAKKFITCGNLGRANVMVLLVQ